MIEILKSGLYDSIQDLGRFGVQDFGVPYSGAMDSHCANLANAILGNSNVDAVLEMTMMGPKLLFHCDSLIAICGAYLSPKLNGMPIFMNTSYSVCKGDVLGFGQRRYGCRSYLAVKGGFQTEQFMGSRSMHPMITRQSQLKKTDLLPILTINLEHKEISKEVNSNHFDIQDLEVYKGMEFHLLSQREQNNLLSTQCTVSNVSNRMAYQVDELMANDLDSIITSSVLPGTIQLTPSGKLLILMRDCQVTGGYPRVLQLTEQSINQLAQKISGEKFRFKCID